MVDCATAQESTLFTELDDENGGPPPARILDLHALAIPDPEAITVTTARDSQTRTLTAKPTIELVEDWIRNAPAGEVDPRTKFAFGFLRTDCVEIYAGKFWTCNFSGTRWSVGIDSRFNGLSQAVQWFKDGVREWARANPRDFGRMVQNYASEMSRDDVVKVLADTYSFAMLDGAFANTPEPDLPPDARPLAARERDALCVHKRRFAAAGPVPRHGAGPRAERQDEPVLLGHGRSETQQQNGPDPPLRGLFCRRCELWPIEKSISMFAQNKYPPDNPGDCLLACQAASLGRMYYDDPRLNFRERLWSLRKTPEKSGAP